MMKWRRKYEVKTPRSWPKPMPRGHRLTRINGWKITIKNSLEAIVELEYANDSRYNAKTPDTHLGYRLVVRGLLLILISFSHRLFQRVFWKSKMVARSLLPPRYRNNLKPAVVVDYCTQGRAVRRWHFYPNFFSKQKTRINNHRRLLCADTSQSKLLHLQTRLTKSLQGMNEKERPPLMELVQSRCLPNERYWAKFVGRLADGAVDGWCAVGTLGTLRHNPELAWQINPPILPAMSRNKSKY